jgi:hypothetical protein
LSGKGSIYERYEEDCEKNGQIHIPKQTMSQKIGMSFAISQQMTILKRRRRDGIRLKKRQQDQKKKQLAAQP